MITNWTNKDIEEILVQLDTMGLPFENYQLSNLRNGLNLLGSGSYANVYGARKLNSEKEKYAIKIIGFADRHVAADTFVETVKQTKDTGFLHDNFVQVYDFVQLKVWIEGSTRVVNVEKVPEEETLVAPGDYLFLQCLVMEKLDSVFVSKRYEKPTLYPDKLATFDENEILKLVYDVGVALEKSHAYKLLHRDVKLENIFFDEERNTYKLGDFGIAKLTDDGMAQTRAFTKGYGAPEVIAALESYDCTADIYSLGMVMYVLLNKLCFPCSDGYYVNVEEQYRQGYVFPKPDGVREDVYEIVKKMCAYDYRNRYQSMKECLADLSGALYGKLAKYKEKHQKEALILGAILAPIGCVLGKMAFSSFIEVDVNFWNCLYLIVAMSEGFLKKTKAFMPVCTCVFWIGLVLWVVNGFSLPYLILLLVLWFSEGKNASIIAGSVLAAILADKFLPLAYVVEYKWIAVTTLLLAVILLLQTRLLELRSRELTDVLFKNNAYWALATIVCFFVGFFYDSRIAICGVLFCAFWFVRERVLS